MKRALFIMGFCGIVLAMQASARAEWTFAGGYQWESYNGKYYALTHTGDNATWDMVRQEALAIGGDLVVVNSTMENTWLAATMFSSPDYHHMPLYTAVQHLWIGLYQPNTTNPDFDANVGWEWVNGSSLDWSSWAVGQASDGGGPGGPIEDWTALKIDGTWNDYNPFAWELRGYDGIQGIIEMRALPTVPAPAALAIASLGAVCVSWIRRRRML